MDALDASRLLAARPMPPLPALYMGLRDEIAGDVAEINADLAEGNAGRETFRWAGTDYPCGASTERTETILTTDGNTLDVVLSLQVRHSDFPPNNIPPQSGQRIVWNGRTYKVAKVDDIYGAAAWLRCIDINV